MAKKTPSRFADRTTRYSPPSKKKDWRDAFEEPDYKGPGRRVGKKNPGAVTISGWVKAKAVKIVRNKAGKAVSVRIKT